tara:strand:+ start:557 stop:736 length:180 start_codon:yes stop_codon:yes gene_type:complete
MKDDIGKARFNRLRNEFNAMQLELEGFKSLASSRKKTVDSLSAELSRYKRKEKRNKNSN